MESVEVRIASLERRLWSVVESVYAVQLTCESLVAQISDEKNKGACPELVTPPVTPAPSSLALATPSSIPALPSLPEKKTMLVPKVNTDNDRMWDALAKMNVQIENVRRDISEPARLYMSAVTEITAKQMNMEMKLQQILEERNKFSTQQIGFESQAVAIDMQQRVEKLESCQDSQLEVIRNSLFDEVLSAVRSGASPSFGLQSEAAAAIAEQHPQKNALANLQPASITVPRVAASEETDDEEAASVPHDVCQAENFDTMICDQEEDDWQDRFSLFHEGRKDYYTFKESTWDLSIFLGVPQMGVWSSAFLLLVLCVQISAQLALVCIINESFTEPDIDETIVHDMYKWRVYSGHSFHLVDRVAFEPLAKRICSHDASVPYSDGVSEIFELISEYMPLESDYNDKDPVFGHLMPHTDEVGIRLCMICIGVWLMNIFSSLNMQWQFLHAFRQLHFAEGVCIRPDVDDTLTLASMNAPRKVWCVVLISMQILVEVFLGVMGVAYMIATISLRDLLLNCSALLVVLDLDDVFYAALVPREARMLMAALNPLPRSRPKTMKGLNWEVVFCLVCLIVGCTCSYVALKNQADTLEATRHNICGGNQGFVTVTDSAGIVYAGEAPLFDGSSVKNTYRYNAISQLITNEATDLQSFGVAGSMSGTVWRGMTASWWSLENRARQDASQAVDYYNPQCQDMLPISVSGNSPLFLQIIRDAAVTVSSNIGSVRNCEDLRFACSADSILGTRTRQFCPTTCGCDNIYAAGLVLQGAWGCPVACTQSPNASRIQKDCLDESKQSAYLQLYVAGLRSMEMSYPADWTKDFNASISLIQKHGCELIPKNISLSFVGATWANLCSGSPAHIISLIYACPVSCGCHTVYVNNCPTTCNKIASHRNQASVR